MPSSLKAGLIGAAVAVIFSLVFYVPCLGCIAFILTLVLYIGVGALAAYWMEPPRDAGKGAGAGAVAGLVTALAGGLTLMIVNVLRFTVGDAEATLRRQFRQLPPGMRDPWRDLGIDPGVLASPVVAAGASSICCGLEILLAAALGAVGGAILVALRKGDTPSVITSDDEPLA